MKSSWKGSEIHCFSLFATQNFIPQPTMVGDIFEDWAIFQKIPSYTPRLMLSYVDYLFIYLFIWLFIFQKKSLWLIYCLNRSTQTSHLFKESSILELSGKIALENCLFLNKYFNKVLPATYKSWFTHWFSCIILTSHWLVQSR